MGKKIIFESAVHQVLRAAERLTDELASNQPMSQRSRLETFVNSWAIAPDGADAIKIAWSSPDIGEASFPFNRKTFYVRGDLAAAAPDHGRDMVMSSNARQFDDIATAVFNRAGFALSSRNENSDRLHREEKFHDDWAAGTDLHAINVLQRNEACTAPEMRFIIERLGDLCGKTVLDVGCGLGEASVYFALKGANVTALDLSPGMLTATKELAACNKVTIETCLSSSETPGLSPERKFDVIYVGNLLHHVDIAKTIDQLLPFLSSTGTFVSWDPVEYNPAINVYRRLATGVRTPDEHPLRLADLRAIRRRFETVETRFFWLSTLLIFIWMAFVQRRHPSSVRYWKAVVDEAEDWKWLYLPLEALDRVILRAFPCLGWFCWNVVIVAKPRA